MEQMKKMLKSFALAAALALPLASAASAATIVDAAVGTKKLSTLVAAVTAADLVGTLSSPGPFTVFAPTNVAFKLLPPGTVPTLLKPENKDKLVSILTYHVVSGKVESKDLAGKTLKAETAQGSKIFVDGRNGVEIDAAKVVKADIKTSNGIIHVIDTVLMP